MGNAEKMNKFHEITPEQISASFTSRKTAGRAGPLFTSEHRDALALCFQSVAKIWNIPLETREDIEEHRRTSGGRNSAVGMFSCFYTHMKEMLNLDDTQQSEEDFLKRIMLPHTKGTE